MPVKHYNSTFLSENATDELFFALTSACGPDFKSEAAALLEQYAMDCAMLKCSNETEVFLRFHLSDISRQAGVLREIVGTRDSFVSFVGQAPLNGGRIALEAWHLRPPEFEKSVIDYNGTHEVDITFQNYAFLYHCCRTLKADNSSNQTLEEFTALENALKKRGGNIAENCLRTWIYCRDVDNNYAGLVKSRRELFEQYGLNENTHYISSTGIEGQYEECHRLIGMDSYCIFGLETEQIEYMHALDFLSPSKTYGVTFERGTRIIFGDRSHYYISGTASIDKNSEIVHPGDVSAQTDRTIENISALLNNHNADLNDLKIAVVYLRDANDASLVEERLQYLLPDSLPRIMVKAPICRPGWLVEIDAICINNRGNPKYKKFV
ncbi:MAG: Rid family hydrolase [Victivallaceae bacterium]